MEEESDDSEAGDWLNYLLSVWYFNHCFLYLNYWKIADIQIHSATECRAASL